MSLSLYVLSLLALMAWWRGDRVPRAWRTGFAIVLPVLVAVYLWRASSTWLALPLALWMLWVAWLLARSRLHPRENTTRGFRFGVLPCLVVLAFVTSSLEDLLDPIVLPPLSGAHEIAKATWTIPSPDRKDPHDPDPFARREFLVNAYYPTIANTGIAHAPYTSPAMADGLSRGLPAFVRWRFAQDVKALRSRAWQGTGLSPAQARYPVVIFSPGYSFFSDMHSVLLEQLASHGYAVFAITHPGDTPVVEFPDGRRKHQVGWTDQDAVPRDEATRARTEARFQALLQEFDVADRIDAGKLRALQASLDLGRRAPLDIRRDDMRALLDRMQALDAGIPESMFAGRLDLANVAVMGMSYGGPTAQEVCLDDVRCKVVVNLDGEEFGELPLRNNTRPALWLYVDGEWRGPTGSPLRRLSYEQYAGPAYRVGFRGADHITFSDWPFYLPEATPMRHPLARWWIAGRSDRAVSRLTVDYVVEFLDHHLKGRPLAGLRDDARREGVVVASRNVAMGHRESPGRAEGVDPK